MCKIVFAGSVFGLYQLPKSTLGVSRAFSWISKYSRGLNPIMFATEEEGNLLIFV